MMGEYAVNLILLLPFIKFPTKKYGKELLQNIPTQYKTPIQEKSSKVLSMSPTQRTGELPWVVVGRQVEFSNPCEGSPTAHLSTHPYKVRHSRESANFISAAGHTYVFPLHTFVSIQRIHLYSSNMATSRQQPLLVHSIINCSFCTLYGNCQDCLHLVCTACYTPLAAPTPTSMKN